MISHFYLLEAFSEGAFGSGKKGRASGMTNILCQELSKNWKSWGYSQIEEEVKILETK